MLQGLVVCQPCGYAFYGKIARGRVRGRQSADCGTYRCTGTDAHRFAGQAVCDNRSVGSDGLEQAVWKEIRAVLEDPGRMAAEYQRRLDQARESPGEAGDGGDLERRIATLPCGIGRLIDAYAAGVIERGEFEPRIGVMRRRRAQLEAERNLTLLVGRLDEFAKRVRVGLDRLDWSGTWEIIRAMV